MSRERAFLPSHLNGSHLLRGMFPDRQLISSSPLILNSEGDIVSIIAALCKTGAFVLCHVMQASIRLGPDKVIRS